MRWGARVLPLALAAGLVASRAGGASVRLDLTGSAAAATLRVRATNGGDAPATDVAPEVAYQHQALDGEAVPLAPGATHEWMLPLPPSSGPGIFPAIVRVGYRDAGERASIPLVVLVTVPMAPAAAVDTALDTGPGPGLVTARLRVDNPGLRPLAGRVAFVLPSALHTEPESEPVQVPPGERRVLPVAIESRGARAGASYPVYAVLEYDSDGAHQTVVARAEVAGRGTTGARSLPLAVGALALATALGALTVAWRAAARRRPV